MIPIPILPALLLAFGPWASPQEDIERELSEIARRLDSAEVREREAAQTELEAWVRKHGDRGVQVLRRKANSVTPEVRARFESVLNHLARVAAGRKELAVFDALGLPDCKGKTFVLFNNGEWTRSGNPEQLSFYYRLGWVISESEDKITLLENNLSTAVFARDRKLPDDWDRFKDQHPADRPLPGKTRTVDFDAFCKKLLSAGPKEDFGDFDHFSRGGLPHGLEPTLYAWWAFQRGSDGIAMELLELARKSAASQDRDDKRTFPEILRDAVAGNLRWQVVTRAHEGAARAEVVKTWQTVEKIAPGFRDGEAVTMIRLYEELLAEDARWVEPAKEDLARSPAARVDYWMYRLRDHAATQMDQPGSCYVLGMWSGIAENTPNPADELVKLGWDALPVVIARLDDSRPTRCMGYWRNFAPDSFYLLRYGDCCQQIFEAITGFSIYGRRSTSGAMVKDGEAVSSKILAQKWWKENGPLGPEKYYLKGLDSAESAAFSAEKLLELDKSKHLPSLIEKADRPRKAALLSPLLPHLSKEHQGLIEPFLKEDDPDLLLAAGQALWEKCGSDEGAREVLARLKTFTKGQEDHSYFFSSSALEFLVTVPRPWVEEGILQLMRSEIARIRAEAMRAAGALHSRKATDALVGHLEDKTSTGWSSGYSVRFCDVAAETLIRIFELSRKIAYEGSEEERERRIAELKAWWNKNKDSIDWDELRRKAEEERKKR